MEHRLLSSILCWTTYVQQVERHTKCNNFNHEPAVCNEYLATPSRVPIQFSHLLWKCSHTHYVHVARLQIRAHFWLGQTGRSIAIMLSQVLLLIMGSCILAPKKDSFLPTIRGYGGVHLGTAKEISNFFHSNDQSCYKTRNQAYRQNDTAQQFTKLLTNVLQTMWKSRKNQKV